MSDALTSFDRYVASRREIYLAELGELCALQSVSARGQGLQETAAYVAARMAAAGLRVRLLPTSGAPAILGEIGSGPRTLLIYAHYDVQPPDPLDQWETEPFTLTAREAHLYARGVSDNKGPLMARIQALAAWQHAAGAWPIRVLFLVEGEEEIGSPHLAALIAEHRQALASDLVLWEGGGRDPGGRPIATLGQKGIATFQLHVRTAARDVHSLWGSLVPAALWRMVWALGALKSADERIEIEGIAEHVRPPSPQELQMLDRIPFDAADVIRQFGVAELIGGVSGRAALLRQLFEPSLTINGLWGGYTGPGSKTVLPAEAHAKLDLRLVPDLMPKEAAQLLRLHLDRAGFPDIETTMVSGTPPFRSRADHPLIATAIAAGERAYGEPVIVYPTTPGSGPMYHVCGPMGAPGISIGAMNHMGANVHGPNENIAVVDYFRGIRVLGCLIDAIGDT
jgi:acetylornithine deacetylase/succinyl-diaminopimelate desuccinylase-like protein